MRNISEELQEDYEAAATYALQLTDDLYGRLKALPDVSDFETSGEMRNFTRALQQMCCRLETILQFG